MQGTKHVEATIVSRESTAGHTTRTCEDPAGKNAQTQIRARQPVITSAQRITPDSDALDRRMLADGSAGLNQCPATRAHSAQVAGPNAANFKRQPKTKILKYHRTCRRFSAPPTVSAENTPGLAFAPVWAGRPTTASTLGPGILSLWVVPFPSTKWLVTRVWAKAHHVPRCGGCASKLNSFLLAKEEAGISRYPRLIPFPVLYWLTRLWASDSSSSFDTVRQRGMSHKILALRSAP